MARVWQSKINFTVLLYKRITGARELGFEDIPSLMNEYNELEDVYFGRIKSRQPSKIDKIKGDFTNT